MFDNGQVNCELVLFWGENAIQRSMMYQDFEAMLDGIVGLSNYAGENMRAAYIKLDDALQVRSVVLFNVRFEADGFPERSWNIPLRHMVEIAARGPDLGYGPIQLACRSQCPISWHSSHLWDPDMRAESSTFKQILTEAETAAGRFGFRATRHVSSPNAADDDFPVLTEASKPGLGDVERESFNKQIQDLSLHITTLETERAETINRLTFTNQQQVDVLETQNNKLLSQYRSIKAQFEAQREQLDALRNQLSAMTRLEGNLVEERRLHEQQLAAAVQAGAEAQKFEALLAQKDQELSAREARWREESRLSLEVRMEEEASRHQMQLDSVLRDLRDSNEQVRKLSSEIQALKQAQVSLQQATADSLLNDLAGAGVNFIAFHPGVGNLSIPVNELAAYILNPLAYAANKAMVSEEQYRHWLDHHNNPRCLAPIGEGKCCEARLIRIDSPSRFVVGQSNLCARHQSADSAIANVLRFN